ncbi:uncharacterized protein LOC141856497 isoform X2 [Brevipalpus obovatus]|uniref:uncharacterized protein LOC141856497 isoform X2 n=1 Tax=Brevipalpus obovatus TaxID=246614 RepID=UPI003D9E5F8A
MNNYFFEGLLGLGGISSAIAIWIKIDKNTTFLECLRIIVSRFLTTQPIILATIFLEVAVSSFLRGPGLSVFNETPIQACEKNLLHHILHMKTFVGKNIMCAPHFWSLSAEFHLFTLAVFLIFLYHQHKTLSKIIMTLLSVGGLAYTVSVFYRFSLTPLFFVYPFKFSDGFLYTMNSYLTTSTHLWIYVGTVLFFVLMMEKFDEKFTMV